MHVRLNGDPLEEVRKWIILSAWDCKWQRANGGCERDVVHRMVENVEKCAQQ